MRFHLLPAAILLVPPHAILALDPPVGATTVDQLLSNLPSFGVANQTFDTQIQELAQTVKRNNLDLDSCQIAVSHPKNITCFRCLTPSLPMLAFEVNRKASMVHTYLHMATRTCSLTKSLVDSVRS